ncbi:MAG TPA: hypothetical protein VEH00_04450 [Steroidobacteraceae bacterium]|nr:hypothetical protein [Steroidobacteraceae bacterium]
MPTVWVTLRSLLAKGRHHAPQRAASAASVSIHVRNVAQMFNSLDPSPFWDRDLDREAAEFIEEEFSEKLSAHTWHLHVRAQDGAALAADLQAAVEHYYERLANSARYRLRDEMRVGQVALLGGVAIFLLSMTIRGILAGMLRGSAPRMLDEGLIIIAWLALWRPVETLLYGWVPLYRRRRLYERLAAVRVAVRVETGTEGAHVEHATVTIPPVRAVS